MRGNLEARLVAALRGHLSAGKLAALTDETEVAIRQAEASAQAERQRALDPLSSPDPRQARAAMEDAAFRSERLRSLLPRLQARYEQVAAAEERERWKAKYGTLKVRRDALSAELANVYPEVADKLADLFERIAVMDAEISSLHQARPASVPLHLASVELDARGLTSFTTANPSIARDLRLPAFANGRSALWPPPEVPLAVLAVATSMPGAHSGPDWFRDNQARAMARSIEAERVAQYHRRQQREREERENRGQLR
jgi:hypothetical protein